MKAIFIAFNQAYNDEITEILEENGQRGFTRWTDIQGRGTHEGEPHYGNHAWPVMNIGIMAVVPDDKVAPILTALKARDEAAPDLGLRAYSWHIEAAY